MFDEPGFLRAGYANLTAGVAKSATGNLIFAQAWISLPLLALHPEMPTEQETLAAEPMSRELGRLFIYHQGNDWRPLIRSARVMNILLGLGAALLVWRWSRKLFGPLGGVLSLLFYCLSPLIISNSAVATTDIAVTLWFLFALQRFWVLVHRVSPLNLLTCGVGVGLLLVTKVSGLLIFPVMAVLLVARLMSKRPLTVNLNRTSCREVSGWSNQLAWLSGAAIAMLLVVLGTIWLCYAPTLTIFKDPTAAWPWADFANQPRGLLGTIAEHLRPYHLLPDSYLFDVRVFDSSAGVRRAYLLGNYSVRGWWYYFPVAWITKTPVPFVLTLALAIGAVFIPLARARRRAGKSDSTIQPDKSGSFEFYELIPLVVFASFYFGGAMASSLNIGVRHLLPSQPPLFILAGAIALAPLSRWRGLAAISAAVWSCVEVVRVSPDFMAYCTPFVGGTANGHRALVDSSYEWGQDLPAVEHWLDVRAKQPGAKPPVYFSYFGNADLSRFKIDAVLLPQFYELRPRTLYPLRPGTYIVSATMLHTIYGPVMGPWRPSYEAAYQHLTAEMQRLEALLPTPSRAVDLIKREGEDVWGKKQELYDALRFARLCAYLRQREPDARITAGMLVFELTLDDLKHALTDPSVELRVGYEIPGTEDLPQSELGFLK